MGCNVQNGEEADERFGSPLMESLRQVVFNPTIDGHFLVKPMIASLEYASNFYQDLELISREAEFVKKFCDRLLVHGNSSIQITEEEFDSFEFIEGRGISLHPALQGVIFDVEKSDNGGYCLRLLEGFYDFSRGYPCENRTSLIGSTVLSLFIAGITVPLAFAGWAVKTMSYLQDSSKIGELFISQVSSRERSRMIKTMRIWKRFAEDKSKINQDQRAIFKTSSSVSASLALDFLEGNLVDQKIYVCKDLYGFFQGVLVLNEGIEELKVSYLLSHPRNIRAVENESEPYRVQRVGTALLDFAAQTCLDLHKDKMVLDGFDSCKSFYLKYARFQEEKLFDEIDGISYRMELSCEEIVPVLNRRKLKEE